MPRQISGRGLTRATGGAVRKYIRMILGSPLAAVLLAGPGGSAPAQQPAAGVTPVPGAWTPRVIATAQPVNDSLPPVVPVQPAKPGPPAVLPIARGAETAPELGQPGGATQRVAAVAAVPGPCLAVEKLGASVASPGKPFVYELVVRNVGSAEAQRAGAWKSRCRRTPP